ncbi:hypothetical protein BH24PSE2_BH24PSE2_05280 [soil metagenome]
MQTIELSPNCSLTPRAARVFFSSMATVSLAIAGLFAAQGYWPVLPFAGAELALLGGALIASMRYGRQQEVIRILDDRVVVEKHGPQGGCMIEFSRYWARVVLSATRPGQPARLLLRSHGRQCEIGRFLTEQDRLALKRRLEKSLAPAQ